MCIKYKCPYCGEFILDEEICKKSKTKIYFNIVFEDELRVDDLTNILGIKPDIDSSWNKGDERKRVKGRYYEFSRWSMPSLITEDLLVEEQVLKYIKPLLSKIDLLNKLKNEYELYYVIEIIPNIENHLEVPSLSCGKELIDFCYKTGTVIDIDMYL